MTEAEWNASEDVGRMLAFARHAVPSDRKLRLTAQHLLGHVFFGRDPDEDGYPNHPFAWLQGWFGAVQKREDAVRGATLLRDLVNPWLPPLPAECRTPTVMRLAEAAYRERTDAGTLDSHRLLILADALEEAGCDNGYILGHLRGDFFNESGERVVGCYSGLSHFRGCWTLDLVLGKE